MASAPSKTTTVRTVNNKTGVTTSTSTHVSAGHTTVTKTTTIGKPKAAAPAKKATTAPAKLAAPQLADRWIAGPNDGGWALCGPVAFANALLAATGTEAGNGAIERLYRHAGGAGDTGAPVEFLLSAAAAEGLAGCRLAGWDRTADLADADLLLLTVAGLPDLHAAAYRDGRVMTWGEEIPLAEFDARIIDAWSLTWHGMEVPCGR